MSQHTRTCRAIVATVVAALAFSLMASPASAGDGPCFEADVETGEHWICGLYFNLLHDPETAEVNFWRGVFNDQGRAPVAHGIVNSAENVEREVGFAYQGMLERDPDLAGLQFWRDAILDGDIVIEDMYAGIGGSAEYLDLHGEFIDGLVLALYEDVIGRTGLVTDAEVNFWVDLMGDGPVVLTVAQVASFFAHSTERAGIQAEALYLFFLDRAGDAGGLTFWRGRIDAVGESRATEQFLVTDEVFENIFFAL